MVKLPHLLALSHFPRELEQKMQKPTYNQVFDLIPIYLRPFDLNLLRVIPKLVNQSSNHHHLHLQHIQHLLFILWLDVSTLFFTGRAMKETILNCQCLTTRAKISKNTLNTKKPLLTTLKSLESIVYPMKDTHKDTESTRACVTFIAARIHE